MKGEYLNTAELNGEKVLIQEPDITEHPLDTLEAREFKGGDL